MGVELVSERLHLTRIRLSIDEMDFEGEVRYVSSGSGLEGIVPTFIRLNYELAAYVLFLLPRTLPDWLAVRVRLTSPPVFYSALSSLRRLVSLPPTLDRLAGRFQTVHGLSRAACR